MCYWLSLWSRKLKKIFLRLPSYFTICKNINLTFRGPCTMMYSYNKSQQDVLYLNFVLVKNSTCFGQTYCPSSGVSTLCTSIGICHTSCVGKYLLLCIQCWDSWWWTVSLSETCSSLPKQSWEIVHLAGFYYKSKNVTLTQFVCFSKFKYIVWVPKRSWYVKCAAVRRSWTYLHTMYGILFVGHHKYGAAWDFVHV